LGDGTRHPAGHSASASEALRPSAQESEAEGSRVKDRHPFIFTHPGLAQHGSMTRKLREAGGDHAGDLVLRLDALLGDYFRECTARLLRDPIVMAGSSSCCGS